MTAPTSTAGPPRSPARTLLKPRLRATDRLTGKRASTRQADRQSFHHRWENADHKGQGSRKEVVQQGKGLKRVAHNRKWRYTLSVVRFLPGVAAESLSAREARQSERKKRTKQGEGDLAKGKKRTQPTLPSIKRYA